jgi:hypothetical protein
MLNLILKLNLNAIFSKDFIICIEMFAAAIAHIIAFTHKPYKLENIRNSSWWRNLLNAANISDVHSDVVEHCKNIGSKVRVLGSLTSSFASSRTSVFIDSDSANEKTRLLASVSHRTVKVASVFEAKPSQAVDEVESLNTSSASDYQGSRNFDSASDILVQESRRVISSAAQNDSSMINFYADITTDSVKTDSEGAQC